MPKINAYIAGNYMLWVSNANTRKSCETRSNFTIKTPERRQWQYLTPGYSVSIC